MGSPRSSLTRRVVVALTAVGATTAAVLLPSLHATAGTGAPVPAALQRFLQSAALPSYGTSTLGDHGWTVRSSAQAGTDGTRISDPSYRPADWLAVTNDDGGAPGTEIEALQQNGNCPNVFYSDRMKQCYGTQEAGKETVARFAVPWWFRTTFPAPPAGQRSTLVINGVVGEADVWVNGHRVATHAQVQGLYTRYTFDVTSLLQRTNAVAIAVHPNDPNTMFTENNLDWAQVTPDQNTGIHFPVQLQTSPSLRLDDVHVVQQDADDMSTAALTVVGDVVNPTSTVSHAQVTALVVPPGRNAPVLVSAAVTAPARSTTSVRLTPQRFAALTLRHPQVWWPYRMGDQPLYTLVTALSADGRLQAAQSERFGIRTVSSRLIGAGPLAPGGVRQYTVNGRPFTVRGGGWSEDLLLHYSAADTDHQITLLKNLGLNTIRLEGHFMPQDFYDRMDRAGVLVASGYQCCNAWELDPDTALTADQTRVLNNSAHTIARDLRDHPSVFTMQWSDNQPTDAQEAISLRAWRQEDFDVPVVASAEYKSTDRLGLSGEKEGPYDWVPPAYWWDRTHTSYAEDSSLTNVGGAWALDTEQSAGHTVPTPDSMNRFLSPADQKALWSQPKANQYHANAETGLTGYNFGVLYNFDTALAARYGNWDDLSGFTERAQVQNYEDTRAQFEAFVDHAHDDVDPSTGTIYWQANKGWPTLLWDLWNYDYDTAGSYYGAQEANRPLHALLTSSESGGDDTVSVDNLGGSPVSGLSVEATVRDLSGRVLDRQRVTGLSVGPEQVRQHLIAPEVDTSTTKTWFVELVLRRGNTVVDRNVYWRSARADRVDWAKTEGNPQATMTQYADYTALQDLPSAAVRATAHTVHAGGTYRTTVTVTNPSGGRGVAFFLRADLRRGSASGRVDAGDNEVRPAAWDADDITLWPGERQTLTVTYDAGDLRGRTPVVSLSGWNVPASVVRA